MKKLLRNTVFYAIYLIGTLFVLPFFIGWNLYAGDGDLLRQVVKPTLKDSKLMIDLWENVNRVWNNMIKWSFEISNDGVTKKPSIIVKITRLLLILTIALSVTMILYNGMIYIIQTGQGKEWKSLIKNVALIVAWILISLFSVVIINLIQSVPNSLNDELSTDSTHENDNEALEPTAMSWKEIWKKLFGNNDSEPETPITELETMAKDYFTEQWYTDDRMKKEGGVWFIQLNTWWYWVELVPAYLDAMGM